MTRRDLIMQFVASQPARKRRHYPPQTRGYPSVDGAPHVPNFGAGINQHPLLPIYKRRAKRTLS